MYILPPMARMIFLEKFYDCNERIILSAIAFLTLPDTVIELHSRIPMGEAPKYPPKREKDILVRLSRIDYQSKDLLFFSSCTPKNSTAKIFKVSLLGATICSSRSPSVQARPRSLETTMSVDACAESDIASLDKAS